MHLRVAVDEQWLQLTLDGSSDDMCSNYTKGNSIRDFQLATLR